MTEKTNNERRNPDYKPEPFEGYRVDKSGQQKKGRRVYRWLLRISAALALLVICALVIAVTFDRVDLIQQWSYSAKTWLSSWRLLCFVLIIGGWRYGSSWYAQWTGLDDNQLDRMLDYRWRVALWLLVMEAIFSQNILTELFSSHSMEPGL